MPFNPLHGISASVKIATTAYAFDSFKFSPKNKLADVSNFTGAGFKQFIAGMTDGKVSLTGPYDEGNMPFTVGNAYTLVLGYTGVVSVSCPCLCESIDMDVKVDDAQKSSLTFQITGSFTAAIA
jgi:hypothetical protein